MLWSRCKYVRKLSLKGWVGFQPHYMEVVRDMMGKSKCREICKHEWLGLCERVEEKIHIGKP